MDAPGAEDVLPDISEAFDMDSLREALFASRVALEKWIIALTPFAKFSATYIKRHPTVALSVLGVIVLFISIRMFLRSAFVQNMRRRWGAFCGRVQARYNNTQAWVAQKSRVVAMIAPHLFFAGFLYFLNQFAPSVVEFLLSDDAFLVICGVLPVAAAAITLAASQHPDPASVHYWLKYIAIFQVFNFLFSLPFMGIVAELPYVQSTRKSLLYWMLLPLVDATNLVFNLLNPLLGPLIQLLPVNMEGGVLGMALRGCVTMGMLSERTSNALLGLLRGGIGALIAIPFVLSVGSITHLGGNIVGILYPALMSLGTVAPAAHLHWLAYWVLFSLVYSIDLLLSPVTSWIPFFNHARLFFFVALQLPQLRAAERLLRLALGLRGFLRPARSSPTPPVETGSGGGGVAGESEGGEGVRGRRGDGGRNDGEARRAQREEQQREQQQEEVDHEHAD